MTKSEMTKLLTLINAFYPNSKFNIEVVFEAWYSVLGKFPYKLLERAINEHVLSNKYPPAVCDIYQNAKVIYEKSQEKKRLERDYKLIEEKYGIRIEDNEEFYKKNVLPDIKKMTKMIGNFGEGEQKLLGN